MSFRLLTQHTIFFAVIAILVSIAACQSDTTDVRRFELKGKVVSVDKSQGRVTLDHEEIPNFMDAMTMSFPVSDADILNSMEPGNTVQATLVVREKDRSYWIENPIITKSISPETAREAKSLEPKIGDQIPEFTLTNQDGKKINGKQFQGRTLLVTFIYSRCPLADQCPLMSTNFAEINKELERDATLRSKIHLLSITLDPEHDTPAVLRSYGAGHTQKYSKETFTNWDFATGNPAEIRRVAEFFGVMYTNENGQITHSLRTAIVGPDGKLQKIYHGNEWKPEDVLNEASAIGGKEVGMVTR